MAEALILDAEAVNALANAATRGALADRARAILAVAHEKHALVRVPSPVLAEVCRGPRRDPPINQLLSSRGIAVMSLDTRMAQRAGHLLARAKLDSTHAVDAFVVSSALEFESAVIATGDPKDLRRLAAPFRQITLFSV